MLIGAESQVAVDLSALAPKITGPSHAEVCRGGLHLVRRSGARTPGDMDRARPAPGLSGGSSTTPVSVTVTADATGHVVFRRSVVTPVHKVQPNGPNCDPTVYRAYVAALHGGTLTSRLPG